MEVFGAKANVYLSFNGGIQDLAKTICKGLILPPFSFDTDEEPPHNLSGTCESLGFEIWLEESKEDSRFSYRLKVETELSIEESFNDHMHDLSAWFARYISQICGVKSGIFDMEDESFVIFINGEIQK
ncbi:MAG: hypothetical protein MI975_22950 [Cytophagales bacterium]|nr:hypothetical protein [Cytophagales bacterium]